MQCNIYAMHEFHAMNSHPYKNRGPRTLVEDPAFGALKLALLDQHFRLRASTQKLIRTPIQIGAPEPWLRTHHLVL